VTLRVTLYSKPGCHLCEDALVELRQLARRHPHALEVVDITTDPQLMQHYAERVPVVLVAGREYAAPLHRSVLERALAEARG
jgi:hypothetical protein